MFKPLKYRGLAKARSIALAGPMLAVTFGLAVGTTPASAIEGVHRVPSRPLTNSSPKTVEVDCPSGERVIGGGGEISEPDPSNLDTLKPTLTQLRPFHVDDPDGSVDGYVVSAAEAAPTSLHWTLTAYAMCAKPIPGMAIYPSRARPWSSAPMQATEAVCPAGQKVIGTGAASSDSSGNVVLQVARPSHPGDIARAQAHKVASGDSQYWTVRAYAICAPQPSGYEIKFDESRLRGSEPIKFAPSFPPVGCTDGKQLLSSGAAISSAAPGNVSLQRILPAVAFEETRAIAVENTPTELPWDFIVATSVCAY